MEIPESLVRQVAAQRVIPFVGAGFSASANLPSWESLLRSISSETEDCPVYEDLFKYANGDLLQIAEFLLLRHDGRIGPLRSIIEGSLHSAMEVSRSAPHVELVNLGAPQIYTTNYDNLIERTYQRLGEPVTVVALPKDVAAGVQGKTQVVKYHGDLRHEQTLVLTESSYYDRLDFESPMDLKFRSDLLGRSVLFMGYSFRDINIRIIWFKLMRMMRDIPTADRTSSYIVRYEPNPVLEELNRAVGLHTLVLDPDSRAETPEAKTALLAQFLYELGSLASPRSLIPQSKKPMYVSRALIRDLSPGAASGSRLVASRSALEFVLGERDVVSDRSLRTALLRTIPRRIVPGSEAEFAPIFEALISSPRRPTRSPLDAVRLAAVLKLYLLFDGSEQLTDLFARQLMSVRGRKELDQASGIDWSKIWGSVISDETARRWLAGLQGEIAIHETGEELDDDLAYLAYLGAHIQKANVVSASSIELIQEASDLLDQAAAIYPSIAKIDPAQDRAPEVDEVLNEIREAMEREPDSSDQDPNEDEYDLEFEEE